VAEHRRPLAGRASANQPILRRIGQICAQNCAHLAELGGLSISAGAQHEPGLFEFSRGAGSSRRRLACRSCLRTRCCQRTASVRRPRRSHRFARQRIPGEEGWWRRAICPCGTPRSRRGRGRTSGSTTGQSRDCRRMARWQAQGQPRCGAEERRLARSWRRSGLFDEHAVGALGRAPFVDQVGGESAFDRPVPVSLVVGTQAAALERRCFHRVDHTLTKASQHRTGPRAVIPPDIKRPRPNPLCVKGDF